MATARYKVPSRKRREETERIAVQSSRRRGWRKVVSLLACTVVFCTTYALILPAITQESAAAAPHIHDVTCYTAVMEEGEKTLTCSALEGDELHTHTDDCYTVQMVQKDAGKLTCTDPNHAHNALCYGQWELNCPLLWVVADVMVDIEALPSADQIADKVAAYEAAHDTEGEEKYYTEITQEVNRVYRRYEMLSEWQKTQVVNADKLLELEFIWSRTPLVLVQSIDVYMINSYTGDPHANSNSTGTILFNGGSPGSYNDSFGYRYWTAIVVEQNADGTLTVGEVVKHYNDKTDVGPSKKSGFVLFIWEGTIHPNSINVSVGDFVFATLDRTKVTGYTGSVQGTVSFYSDINDVTINSPAPTVGAYTSTKDFVELNLYDYNYNINANWKDNNKYPGFQWNGGAYSNDDYQTSISEQGQGVPYIVTDRHRVDSIDFGNSMITNHTYGGSSSGTNGKANGAISVGKLYNNSESSSTGLINWLWYDGSDYSTTTNRPVGMSTGYQSLSNTLVNGYPALNDDGNTSLAYLFTNGGAVTKQNTESIDGLFLQNPVTGAYAYNSRENHAQYSNNFFTRYDQIITPNFLLYPFGNFLPLNRIQSDQSTQLTAFNIQGGMKKYVDKIINNLNVALNDNSDYADDSRRQLITMLQEYAEHWTLYPRTFSGTSVNWNNLMPGNAIRDFFWKDDSDKGDGPTDENGTGFIKTEYFDELYNIDWDKATNFFFGMEMKMHFMMPKDGLTGNDNGNNASGWTKDAAENHIRPGSPDGIPDYPLIFNFAGDDDVWVYIDDVLFLDLTGIHRHVGGRINMQEGKVYYYELLPADGGDVAEVAYKEYTFAELLTAAGKDTSVLNEKGTFKDYSTHTFNFYYMERGSGSSVCRINFNFPLLHENSISVSKENLPDQDVTLVGDPDYYFNIMYEDPSGELFVGPNSKTGVKTYKIMDSAGNYLKDENGNVKTFETDQYGIFTIKAGQTAIFEGIKENLGEYYVQELIKEVDHNQYNEKVTINGENSRTNNLIDWSVRKYFQDADDDKNTGPYGHKWYAHSGQDTDSATNSAFYFQAINGVVTSKLGKLNITKALGDNTTAPDAAFNFRVTLDGEPLEKGTQYTVGGETKTVQTEGILTLAAGQTATIEGILSGTAFTVQETTESAKGYTVTYQVTDAENAATDGLASGIIRTETTTSVTATNTENRTEVVIPGHKELNKADENKAHKFHFTVQQVDKDGKPVDDGYSRTHEVELAAGVQAKDFSIIIGYSKIDRSQLPLELYYKITEQPADNMAENTQAYVAKVLLAEANDSVTATLASLTDASGDDATTAAFTNTLLGDLDISKQVIGGTDDQRYFRFTVTLRPGDSGLAQLPTAYAVSLYEKNAAESTTEQWSFKQEGGALIFSFYARADERLIIHGIPLGAAWTVKEDTDAYYTLPEGHEDLARAENGWVKNEGFSYATEIYVDETHITGAEASGQINASGTAVTVAYTNSTQYSLPATGGVGTGVFTGAGLLLMLFSAVWLLYKRKRRREAY